MMEKDIYKTGVDVPSFRIENPLLCEEQWIFNSEAWNVHPRFVNVFFHHYETWLLALYKTGVDVPSFRIENPLLFAAFNSFSATSGITESGTSTPVL
jgi:hypothetical protein